METRKETICGLKLCRFCLTRNESVSSMYDGSKAPKTAVPLSLKILYCVGIEIFPSDKMPQFICSRCKFFMELSYAFKHLCRQADEKINQYIQNGTPLEPISWPSMLTKVFRAMNTNKPSEVGVVETVVQSGATVKVMAEEVSDSEEGDDEDVYNVKIGDGPEEGKRIKVVTTDIKAGAKRGRKESDECDVERGCWPCDECECTFPLEQLLSLHKSQKHRARHVECEQCDAKFFNKYDMNNHQLTHSEDMPFECVACGKKFKRLVLLKRHEKIMHSEIPQLQCPHCPGTYLSVEELEAHKQRHDKYLNRPFVCRFCNKRYPDQVILQKHVDNVHCKKSAFSCHYCPEKFPTISKLTRHVRQHAGERSYPCKYCKKSFLKSHHYTRHLRVKHGEEGRKSAGAEPGGECYRCEECAETFNTQDELMYHSALHATTNLVCPLCQEKFDDVDTVTAHIKSHVNGTEFMCDFCELIFTTKEKLETHVTNAHDEELLANEQDIDDDSMDMDAEDDDDNSINVTEEDGHMVVKINKAAEYMLPPTNEEEDQTVQYNSLSEDSDLEEPSLSKSGQKTQKDSVQESSQTTLNASDVEMETSQEQVTAPAAAKQTDGETEPKKTAKDVKAQALQQTASPSVTDKDDKPADKKDKTINNNKAVTSTATSGASDKSLRLLEKELQELKRTSRPENKTPSKPMESLKNKRPQLHTSTPKTRSGDKKEAHAPKVPEKNQTQDKKVQERRTLTKENKEPKEMKELRVSLVKESEERMSSGLRDDSKDDKKENKETPKGAAKNGVSEKPNTEEAVRRSTRPSKIKDYAKMIRVETSSAEESDEETFEEDVIEDKTFKAQRSRRGKKSVDSKQNSQTEQTPPSAPKKRGRPRKEKTIGVERPAKIKKGESSEDEANQDANDENSNKSKSDATQKPKATTPSPKEHVKLPDSNDDVLVSPTGQTLKKVPVKSLPPGVKVLPLPRAMGAGEVCEMQIGKKIVKVQKIVMTKAEVEAMAKKGLVEMKDGTMVLKQGIKLPTGDPNAIKSTLQAETESKQESPLKD